MQTLRNLREFIWRIMYSIFFWWLDHRDIEVGGKSV